METRLTAGAPLEPWAREREIRAEAELEVAVSPAFRPEQSYALDVLLGEFLGLDFRVHEDPATESDVVIRRGGRVLRLPQTLLTGEQAELATCPRPSPQLLDPSAEGLPPERFDGPDLPVLFGVPGADGRWLSLDGEGGTLHADVLGSSFFCLTRMEEVGVPESALDGFGIYPAALSVAHRDGFLTRPVVDEYTELLWCALHTLWPDLRRRSHKFSIRTSHDVDRPMAFDHRRMRDRVWCVRQHARSGTLPRLLGSRSLNAFAAAVGLPHRDPFANFEWLLDLDEQFGLSATFYFLAGGSSSYDGRYDVGSPVIRRLLRRVSERGHRIGLHGSYQTMDDPDMLAAELDRLQAVLREEGLQDTVDSVRQHYLRWRAPGSWRGAEAAGIGVDASVGFNETVGFRAGTCFEYPVFDVERRNRLRVRERPLHVMDRALAALGSDAAFGVLDDMRRSTARHGGTLEILWHNNVFIEDPDELPRYLRVIGQSPA